MARERDYQLGVVINPESGEDQARGVVDRINNLVAANGGQVFRVLAWGRRRLAYPIEHHRDGLYFWFDMQLPPETVAEVERQLHVNEAIIRHLITAREARIVAQERIRAEEAEARAAAQAAEAEERAAASAEASRTAVAMETATETPMETDVSAGQETEPTEPVEPLEAREVEEADEEDTEADDEEAEETEV
jgi:small subunit ribosomal protein S6